jgi:thioesterase domain-containing protein
MARYMPEPYSGRLLVWRSTENACDARALTSLSERVEIHEIAGNHLQILKEPQIRTWAEPLALELRRLGSRAVNCVLGLLASFNGWADYLDGASVF